MIQEDTMNVMSVKKASSSMVRFKVSILMHSRVLAYMKTGALRIVSFTHSFIRSAKKQNIAM